LAATLKEIRSYDITVSCEDDGKPKLTSIIKQFKIYVKQSADVPKLLLLSGKGSVDENKVGALIGLFSVLNELTGSPLGTVRLIKIYI
jgi:hypothetical protein